jgi:hypothetical protein
MARTEAIHGQMTCAIDVSPDVVDAGAELTLLGKVSCSPVCDLQGHTLLVKDQTGADLGSAELIASGGGVNETGELVLKAPAEPGEYTWLAVCPAVMREGVSYADASAPISFTVAAHATDVVAWDVPPAIPAGERFRMKVGVRCSSECQLANRPFEVRDHEGAEVAAATVSGDRWPGTTSLYVAEVELDAPAEEGLFTWSVTVPRTDDAFPHAEGSVSVGVRVVSRPEWAVTIEAVDQETQTPLTGAHVVMHPYRAVTDERGVAEVRVAKGAYTLFVSQTSYLTFGLPIEVTEDTTARAELCLEPVPERN